VDSIHEWLANPIFAALGERVCRELAESSPARLYPPRTALVQEGDPPALHVLFSGTVRIFHRAPDGKETTVKLSRAPMVYGDIETISDLAFLESVASLDEVRLAIVSASRYRELLETEPRAALAHLRHMAAAFGIAVKNELMMLASLEERSAQLVLSYADFFGVPSEEGLLIDSPLSQEDVARSLGSVRRSVANVFAAWRRRKVVLKRGDRLVVAKPEVLEQLAAPLRGGLTYEMGMTLDHLTRDARQARGTLEVLDGPGSRHGLAIEIEQAVVIGRGGSCDLVLEDEQVSSRHCRVFRGATGSRFWIADLNSANETLVNGRPVRRGVLRRDDVVQVGATRLAFRLT
jgi:CRP-like cAMP-binding protein